MAIGARLLLERAAASAMALTLLAAPPAALAEDTPKPPTEQELLKAKNDLAAEQVRTLTLKNEADAARIKRITGLGLPEFDGTAKLEGKAGQMEASLLASAALQKATGLIRMDRGDLVLAAGEVPPGAEIAQLRNGLERLTGGLQHVVDLPACSARPAANVVITESIPGAVTLATTLAGMFRSDVTYTALDVPGVDAQLMADLLAMARGGRRLDTPLPATPSIESTALTTAFERMEQVRLAAIDKHRAIDSIAADKRSAAQKTCHSAAAAALAAADRFDTQWMTASPNGETRFGQTVNFIALLSGTKAIVQVDVRAGGTAMNTSNIGTFFGADPLKISGDTVVTWRRFTVGGTLDSVDPVPTGGMVACASRRLRMSDIHGFVRSDTRSGRRGPDIECRTIAGSS